jgi:hypothetical protein
VTIPGRMLKLAGKADKVKLTIQVLKILLVLSFVTVKSIYVQIGHHVMQGLAETQWGSARPMLPNLLLPAKG